MAEPKTYIRRYDIFAAYEMLDQLRRGLPEDEAKGYGVWIAKVVASRQFGRKDKTLVSGKSRGLFGEAAVHELNGKPQTAETYDQEIIERIGRDFYEEIFLPALETAKQKHLKYEEIRGPKGSAGNIMRLDIIKQLYEEYRKQQEGILHE